MCNAFMPNKLNNRIIYVKLAQGAGRRNVITAGIDAPFLYSWIAIASIP